MVFSSMPFSLSKAPEYRPGFGPESDTESESEIEIRFGFGPESDTESESEIEIRFGIGFSLPVCLMQVYLRTDSRFSSVTLYWHC